MKSPDGRRECSAFPKDKKIALTGKKTTTLYLLNPDATKVEKIEVDGCAIVAGPRCDWLIVLKERRPQEEIYVELKASHINRAVEQIEATIKRLSSGARGFKKRCIVVINRSPMTGTDLQKYKVRFRKHCNATFMTKRDKEEVAL